MYSITVWAWRGEGGNAGAMRGQWGGLKDEGPQRGPGAEPRWGSGSEAPRSRRQMWMRKTNKPPMWDSKDVCKRRPHSLELDLLEYGNPPTQQRGRDKKIDLRWWGDMHPCPAPSAYAYDYAAVYQLQCMYCRLCQDQSPSVFRRPLLSLLRQVVGGQLMIGWSQEHQLQWMLCRMSTNSRSRKATGSHGLPNLMTTVLRRMSSNCMFVRQ